MITNEELRQRVRLGINRLDTLPNAPNDWRERWRDRVIKAPTPLTGHEMVPHGGLTRSQG